MTVYGGRRDLERQEVIDIYDTLAGMMPEGSYARQFRSGIDTSEGPQELVLGVRGDTGNVHDISGKVINPPALEVRYDFQDNFLSIKSPKLEMEQVQQALGLP